jgi:hypothetical protein
MTVLWLLVWLVKDTPPVADWNNWMVALVVCLAIDLLGGGVARS